MANESPQKRDQGLANGLRASAQIEEARRPDLIPTFGTARSMVYPVSRVWFELSDTAAFEKSVDLALDWMSARPKGSKFPRSGVSLPMSARQAQPFDITDELGANPTKAVRLEASDGLLWSARLDWPDPNAPRTWVSEFFVEKRIGHMVRFGAQLTCVRRGDCPPTLPTRPSVVQRVLETLSAEADGRELSDVVERLQPNDVGEIVNLLYNGQRRLPVVVVSEPDEGQPSFLIRDIARHVAGAAHLVYLSREASWELTRQVGKRMSAFRGATRLYQPGLSDVSEDPFAHPLWLPQQHQQSSVLRQIASRVLPAAFLDRAEHAFPRYSQVREAAGRQATHQSSGPMVALSSANSAPAALAELQEERDLWMSLAEEQQAQRLAAENEMERLKAEIIRLEAKSASLEFSLSQRPIVETALTPERRLTSYEELEEWADEVLGKAVYVHSAALKDCRKTGHANMIERIEAALLIMRDHMTPARISGDAWHREQAREKLGQWGFEDSGCFADRDEAKRRPQYSVPHLGEIRVLYDHLKYGTGYNNANQVRIYYFWDEDNKQHVVGKMPSHLRNNLTN